MIQRNPVVSSNISEVAHNPDTQEMEVKFANGNTYIYSGVSAQKYNQLLLAPSVGQFFHTNIRASHPSRQGEFE